MSMLRQLLAAAIIIGVQPALGQTLSIVWDESVIPPRTRDALANNTWYTAPAGGEESPVFLA